MAATLAAVVLPGCIVAWGATSDPGWTTWSRGPFTFHVPTRDLAQFAGLENQTLDASGSLGRALNETLQGPIDVWAYFPDPPAATGEKLAVPAQLMRPRDHGAEILLAAWPQGLRGNDPSTPPSLSIFHELVHVYQLQMAKEHGARPKVPEWLLEGGATLEGLNDTAGSVATQRAVAFVMANATAGSPSFSDAFSHVPPRDRDMAVHFGGAMLLQHLAQRCDLPDPPWVPLVAGIAVGRSAGDVLWDRCGHASEASLVQGWRDALGNLIASTPDAIPAAPPGVVEGSVDSSNRAFFLDACQDSGRLWSITTDHRTALLHHSPDPAFAASLLGLFPETVGCEDDGSAIVLGQAADGGAMRHVGRDGSLGPLVPVPRPLSLLGWNRARHEGYYWTDGLDLVRLNLSGAQVVGPGSGSLRMVFSRDGATAFYGMVAPNGTITDWRASASDPLAAPQEMGEHVRPLLVDDHGVLWVVHRRTGTDLWDVAPWGGSPGPAAASGLARLAFDGNVAPLLIHSDAAAHLDSLILATGPWT